MPWLCHWLVCTDHMLTQKLMLARPTAPSPWWSWPGPPGACRSSLSGWPAGGSLHPPNTESYHTTVVTERSALGGATQKRDRKRDRWEVGVSLSHPPVTVNNAPHWPHMLLYEFGCSTPGRLGPLCKWKRCPCWWVLKILDLDNLEWARKDRACIFRIKIMDEVRIEITTKIKIDIMINIRTKLNWL